MNYEWLFAFVAFAERRNFTRAAEDLHISQPALHVQIKKLGAAVGVRLYVRKGRGLLLTREGERLAAFGRMVQQQGEDVLSELRGESISGPVVLASGQGAFLYLLGAAVRRFPKSRWPLRLLSLRGPEAVGAVSEGRAHLAVAVLDHEPAELVATRLCGVGQVAVMGKKHRLATRRRLRPADLAGEALVVAPVGSPHRMMLEQAMRTDGASLSVGVEATGWELMLEFARDGMGIAIVNDFCPPPRGCVAVAMRQVPQATYYLVERGAGNPAVARMRNLIIETVTGRSGS